MLTCARPCRSSLPTPQAPTNFTVLANGWYRLQAASRAECAQAPGAAGGAHHRPALSLLGASCGGPRSTQGWAQLVDAGAGASWKVYLKGGGRWLLATTPGKACGNNALLTAPQARCGKPPRLQSPSLPFNPANQEWVLQPVAGKPPGTYALVARVPTTCNLMCEWAAWGQGGGSGGGSGGSQAGQQPGCACDAALPCPPQRTLRSPGCLHHPRPRCMPHPLSNTPRSPLSGEQTWAWPPAAAAAPLSCACTLTTTAPACSTGCCSP